MKAYVRYKLTITSKWVTQRLLIHYKQVRANSQFCEIEINAYFLKLLSNNVDMFQTGL